MQMEYDNKLLELDKEKRSIEEEKLLVERYKQLLLKQRDIMIALTSRLNERDETIISLQEEADNYSKTIKELEEKNQQLNNKINLYENNMNNKSNNKADNNNDDRLKAESLCLKDLLSIIKNYTESNDRSLFFDNIENISYKYNLEGRFGNLKHLKEINYNNNMKSVDQMIKEKINIKNKKWKLFENIWI